ncbi:SRPBCC family protein [Luteolibacter ambystomatis]|uniref:SRPBCC family protein n=1 Tax=Luteolibacter ambystomatis TaxID=2824561 RepID=A0A975G7L3_9BACT|nr:SRPBCC family protein [Luteolibacter ambystomatis]QUE50433.1 SRPBCC family protein [Luteolibacter ambystomatis]
MNLHTLTQVQDLPISVAEAWTFFSTPANLQSITPPDIDFQFIGDHSGPMYECRILRYRIGIAPLVRVNWNTGIKAVREGHSFVDEQISGPYRFWHHRHVFEAIEDGTRMTDEIHYAVPFGFIGDLLHPFLVRKELERIFQFRREELVRRFGTVK